MKRIIFILLMWTVFPSAGNAQKEHIIERGETIESIAKLYNMTPQDIINANPIAGEMIYAGMVLTIPESNTAVMESVIQDNYDPNSPDTIEANSHDLEVISSKSYSNITSQNNLPSGNFDKSVSIEDFSSIYLTYTAGFKAFDKGAYGCGFTSYYSKGFGWTFSTHLTYGLVDPGNIAFKFGPTYGYSFNEYFALSGLLRGMINTADKIDSKNPSKTVCTVSGGVTFTPCLILKLNRVIITAGYELGWHEGNDKLYHDFELTLGINI